MTLAIIDGLIPFAGGIYITLVGFGLVSIGRDPAQAEAWRKRWGRFMRISGPLLMLWGLFLIVQGTWVE
jgi:hypothetical protein